MNAFPLDYDMAPEPAQIQAIYEAGFAGTLRDSMGTLQFRGSIPSFYEAFPACRDIGKGKLSTAYKSVLNYEPTYGEWEAQGTGDCVSHGLRNAGMVDYCMDALYGETTYKGRLCTEPQYGERGHRGQGANCGTLANYVSQNGEGGFLVRDKYKSPDGRHSVDLSKYDWRIGHNWGGSGTPDWLNDIAARNKAMRVLKARSLSEARDALYMGFGIFRCSWMSFANKRDQNGFAHRTSKGWAHSEAWTGFDDTDWGHKNYGGGCPLEMNSWGSWNHGPTRLDQMVGSYWMHHKDAQRMINDGSVYIIASVRGYDRRLVYDTDYVQHISDRMEALTYDRDVSSFNFVTSAL